MSEKERISLTIDQLPDSNKINKYIEKAVKAWTDYNNSGGRIEDVSDKYYKQAEKIAQKWANVTLDCGVGLYPTFEIVMPDGKHYTEYNTQGFFRRINGFWD
jgi:hypothetical protein